MIRKGSECEIEDRKIQSKPLTPGRPFLLCTRGIVIFPEPLIRRITGQRVLQHEGKQQKAQHHQATRQQTTKQEAPHRFQR